MRANDRIQIIIWGACEHTCCCCSSPRKEVGKQFRVVSCNGWHMKFPTCISSWQVLLRVYSGRPSENKCRDEMGGELFNVHVMK